MGITYGNIRTKSFIRKITKKRRYTEKNTSKLIDNFKKENDIVNKIPQTEKVPKKSILKKLNISNEEKVVFNNNYSNRINSKDIDNKEDINNEEDGDNKDNIYYNYICSSCKTEIISVYCLN